VDLASVKGAPGNAPLRNISYENAGYWKRMDTIKATVLVMMGWEIWNSDVMWDYKRRT
jgi:hypothetical protein